MPTAPVQTTHGGKTLATVYSGGALSPGSGFLPAGAVKTGDHLLLQSGPGRLAAIIPITNVLTMSGVALVAYDSAVVATSGPGTWANSGYRVLGVYGAPGGLSGQVQVGTPTFFETPFSSGLCIAAVSGVPGFSVSWQTEVSQQF